MAILWDGPLARMLFQDRLCWHNPARRLRPQPEAQLNEVAKAPFATGGAFLRPGMIISGHVVKFGVNYRFNLGIFGSAGPY